MQSQDQNKTMEATKRLA